MTLPDSPSAETEQYSIVLCSMSYASSPSDAFAMFLAQMATGHVGLEIHNSSTSEGWDLDEISSENSTDQIHLAMGLLARHRNSLSNHQRLELAQQVNIALGLPASAG